MLSFLSLNCCNADDVFDDEGLLFSPQGKPLPPIFAARQARRRRLMRDLEVDDSWTGSEGSARAVSIADFAGEFKLVDVVGDVEDFLYEADAPWPANAPRGRVAALPQREAALFEAVGCDVALQTDGTALSLSLVKKLGFKTEYIPFDGTPVDVDADGCRLAMTRRCSFDGVDLKLVHETPGLPGSTVEQIFSINQTAMRIKTTKLDTGRTFYFVLSRS
ncbi:hypothetical protein M885DRAFT_504893 [Pelagophyceae sp. CCMP2097]|nr:hypothetical protein M885DRAFT_504893 [Pelagophyceae sp. CCMP2097]|mmetsp:Transcript_33999/g.117025  ORF Transcript_33999/g.117025 Transcript_33999/m.117025 type:complete len:219 (-) Transcript_33999:66-722(-)